MAWQFRLPHLSHSDLHLCFLFFFLSFFAIFMFGIWVFIFFWMIYTGLGDILFVKEGPRHAPGAAYVVIR